MHLNVYTAFYSFIRFTFLPQNSILGVVIKHKPERSNDKFFG